MQKAIFIGVDGAQFERLAALQALGLTPGLAGLEFISAYAGGDLGTETQQPTVSGPGWSTLLTGTWTNEHGVTGNNGQQAAGESIFDLVDAGIPNASIASIVDWADINTGHFADQTGLDGSSSLVDYEAHGLSDTAVTDMISGIITQNAPDFSFVHLDEVDGAGHSFGFGLQYNQALIKAAMEIGQIMDAVEAREAANPGEDWLVIVGTDHGRDAAGFNHGGQSAGERQIFIGANQDLENLGLGVDAPQTSIVPTILDWLNINYDRSDFGSGSVLAGAGDPIRPTVSAILSPADDQVVVAPDTDLSLRFSEAVTAGAGAVLIHDAATGSVVESIDVTSAAVTIAGDLVTIDPENTLAGGTEYYVTVEAGAFTDVAGNEFNGISLAGTWNFTTDDAATVTTVFAEDWESLAPTLQPFVSPTESGGDGTDWTPNAPTGWTIENNTPTGGPAEFFGWTFIDVDAWTTTAGDQGRSGFTLGDGVVAVADPDEYDDGATPIDPDLFDSTLVSPEIDISDAAGSKVRVSFDSSWLPEEAQEVALYVSFDGGARQQVLHWVSDSASPDFHGDAPNEAVLLEVDRPAGAATMQLAFDMPQAGNDWWWAVDNIKVDVVDTIDRVSLFAENFESLADDLGPLVSPSETGGDGTDWTATLPEGWSRDNDGTPTGGPAEFFGWTFFDKAAWIETAGDQDRSQFTLGEGVVAVADPDEYDDIGEIDPAQFNTILSTSEIDLSGVEAGSGRLQFASSWVPSGAQEARVTVSYDGGAPVEVLRYSSVSTDPDFKADGIDELVTLNLDNPAGAEKAVINFEMKNAGNDWWWAIDNIDVTGEREDGSNAAPVAVADSYAADEDTALVVAAGAGVLANDSDAEGGPLAAALATDATNGTVLLAEDGSFTYTPDADFSGTDTFTYEVTDSDGGSDIGTVTVAVAPEVEGEEIAGTGGDDRLVGGAGDDTIGGLEGHDVLRGLGGADILAGAAGYDTLLGGDGDDMLDGGTGRDELSGGAGADTILAGSGGDAIAAGGDDDVVVGATGADTIDGQRGDDTLIGGAGADDLFGDTGDDFLRGGTGRDSLEGGRGDDLLAGGDGPDVFIFDGAFGHDTVLDLDGDDTIELHGAARRDVTITLGRDGLILDVDGDVAHGSILLRGATAADADTIVFA